MAWQVSGRSLDLCSCKMWCPCWLGPEIEPDEGWCAHTFGFDIRRGNSDGVDLSGTIVAFTGEWPANFFLGERQGLVSTLANAGEDRWVYRRSTSRELDAIFSVAARRKAVIGCNGLSSADSVGPYRCAIDAAVNGSPTKPRPGQIASVVNCLGARSTCDLCSVRSSSRIGRAKRLGPMRWRPRPPEVRGCRPCTRRPRVHWTVTSKRHDRLSSWYCGQPVPRHTPDTPRGSGAACRNAGNRAPCPAPIPAAGPSPRLPTAALGPILGERRGLPEPGPSRGRELLLQPLVLPLQPIVRTLQPIILTSQLIVLTSQLIMLTLHLIPFPGRARRDLLQPRDLFVVVALPFGPLVVDGMRAFIGHARFMADSRQKYKYKIVISTEWPAKRRLSF